MRRQVFATAVSIALLFGAAAPALAAGKGKAKGHVNKPVKTKPAPKAPNANKNKHGVSGGGTITQGTFSAQARMKHQPKGHFNFTGTGLTLRCKAFVAFEVAPTNPATVKFTKCSTITGTEPTEVKTPADDVSVVFTDNGAVDSISFDFGGTTYAGTLSDGNIKIR